MDVLIVDFRGTLVQLKLTEASFPKKLPSLSNYFLPYSFLECYHFHIQTPS